MPNATMDPYSPITLPVDGTYFLHIGAIRIWFVRKKSDWTLRWVEDVDQDAPLCIRSQTWNEEPPEDANQARLAFSEAPQTICVSPVLADRPFVVAPEIPIIIPPGENIVLHVGAAMWLRLSEEGAIDSLLELPTSRPSDTWFGPNTRSGELCYVARTKARMYIDEFDERQNRAITTISMTNHSKEPLEISSLKIPIPILELYVDDLGRYHTRGIVVDNKDDGISIRLAGASEHSTKGHVLVSGPRQPADRNVMLRTFEAIAEISQRLV